MTPPGEPPTGLLRLVLAELRGDAAARAELRELVAEPVEAEPPRPTAYTAETLAAELGVTPRAVRAWIAAGELPAVKRAGRWVIAASTVEAWASPDPSTPGRPRTVRARRSNRSPLRDALDALRDAA